MSPSPNIPTGHLVKVLHLDGNRFIYADGVLLARLVIERNTLQFIDKDKRRCSERGTRYIEVLIPDLADIERFTRRPPDSHFRKG